jgi:hypothetical protein
LAQAMNQTAAPRLAHTEGLVSLPVVSPRPPRDPADAVGEKVIATEAAAREIISAIGRPVPTREMLTELDRRGFAVGGKDPMATLTTRLSRAPSLENHRPYGWRLKEPHQEIGAAGPASPVEPAASDPEPNSDPVEPVVGGGT